MLIKGDSKNVTLAIICPLCGNTSYLTVPTDGYTAWKLHGVLVQDAFPQLSAEDRELLISGICPTCWDNLFSCKDEENEDYEIWDDDDDDPYENDDWSEMGFDPYLGEYSWDC